MLNYQHYSTLQVLKVLYAAYHYHQPKIGEQPLNYSRPEELIILLSNN